MSGPPGAALAIDVGTVRVGVAASDPGARVALPVTTLGRRDRELWSRLGEEVAARGAVRVVVGLPRAMSGEEGDAARAARDFAAEAERRLGLPVELWDERLTTVQAERALLAGGLRRRRRRAVVDAVAATLLLQSWLDAREAERRTATAKVR